MGNVARVALFSLKTLGSNYLGTRNFIGMKPGIERKS